MEIEDTLTTDDEVPTSASDLDDYPELLALEEEERPLKWMHDDSGPSDFSCHKLGLETFQWVLSELDQNDVSPEVVMTLWHRLITEEQRRCILKQLRGIGPGDHSPEALTILNKTTLSDLIKAWADLKQLVPSNLRLFHHSAWDVAMNILRYCIMLEQAKAQGLPIALKCDVVDSDPFSNQPTTGYRFDRDTPLEQLIEAFADRVKCRKAHPEWLSFTNIIVLREMAKYVRELQGVVLAITPFLSVDVRIGLRRLEE